MNGAFHPHAPVRFPHNIRTMVGGIQSHLHAMEWEQSLASVGNRTPAIQRLSHRYTDYCVRDFAKHESHIH
jgi:hypothetical protein